MTQRMGGFVELQRDRMTTERWTDDMDAATFANVIVHKALAALGDFKDQAQELAARTGRLDG